MELEIWEKLFFRVWKSQYLISYIFGFIKGTGKSYSSINSVSWICNNKHFGVLKDKIEQGFIFKYDVDSCSLVAQNVELELFKRIYQENRSKFQVYSIGVNEAAIKGNMDVIKYLVEVENLLSINTNERLTKKGLTNDALDNALIHNQLETLEYLHENFPNLSCTYTGVDGAVENGHVSCVKWLVECTTFIGGSLKFSKSSFSTAVKKGYHEIVKLVYKKQPLIECDRNAFNLAALDGHLEVIKFLTENGDHQATVDAMNYAAQNGHLQVVKYLNENRKEGCTTYAMDTAAKNGHLDIVIYLQENRKEGCTVNAPNHAAISGHLKIVEYLLDHRINEDVTSFGFDYTCFNGNLPMVELLHKRNKKCSSKAMDMAAQMGYLNIVEFLHCNRKEGCTTNAMDLAALGGHLKVIEFLHNNRSEGCTEAAIDNAAQMGHLNIVSFLLNHLERPTFKNAISLAELHGHFEISSLLKNNLTFQL